MALSNTSTTGIAVRTGTTLQLGGLSSQPIPFVVPTATPVAVPVSPIIPVLAPPAVSTALQTQTTPALAIPASVAFGGARVPAQFVASVQNILPPSLVQIRPSASPAAIGAARPTLTAPRRPTDEVLSLSHLQFQGQTFEQADPHGINTLRPEIISLMDYEPVFVGSSLNLNDVGLLMDVQYRARKLREQTLLNLIGEIKKTDQNNRLADIQKNFTANFDKINAAADFYENTITTLETIKDGFDVKSIPNGNFDLRHFRTLRNFYESFMLFPRDAVNGFSNTKIMMQLLFDLRSVAENHSMNLLNVTDPDRQAGGSAVTSPVSIDKSYNPRNGFSLTFESIRSFGLSANASARVFFNRFVGSLPSTPDDRTKVLLTMLSKELRVSKGLGQSTVQRSLRDKFGATTTDGNPFDNLLGGVGATIFEPVLGPNSVASLMVVNDTPGFAVLPFETKYIDVNNTHKVYTPGSAFFVDSIINTTAGNSFNTQPLRQYVEKYTDTVDSLADVMSRLFDFGAQPSALSPVALLKSMFQGIVSGLPRLGSNEQLSAADACMAAALRMAASNSELKYVLFQYVLLKIMSSPASAPVLTDALIEEFGNDIRNFVSITFNADDPLPDLHQPNEIRQYLDRLAQTIQDLIARAVEQTTILDARRAVQTRDRQQTRTDGRTIVGFDVDSVSGIPAALAQSSILGGFVRFIDGLETLLGNEVNNFLDTAGRTRFNALSVSTLTLMGFEAYLNLVSRFVNSDFQASQYGSNFPDMAVDRPFNDRMLRSMQAIMSDPELPLPVVEPVPGTNGLLVPFTIATQRTAMPVLQASALHVTDQASKVAGTTATAVVAGTLSNQNLLAGNHATAGAGFAGTADLVLRNISPHINVQTLMDAQAIDQSMNSIVNKLFQDDFAVACGIHILLVVKRRLRGALDVALNYFTDQTLNSFVSLNVTSPSDVGRNLTPTQVRLLIRLRDNYTKSLTQHNEVQFVPITPTEEGTRSALLGLLGKSIFRDTTDAGERYRLLTVGLPAGFSKKLADRLNSTSLNSTSFQKDKSYDVVYVNVYKRSLEFPEVIFQPQKFIFDLSLFSNGYKNLNLDPTDTFESILGDIALKDYQTFRNPTDVTIDSIVDDERYSFIADPKLRRKIVENHILSDLFGEYVRFLTTMKLSEESFVNQNSTTYRNLSLGSGTDLSPAFAELVRRFLVSKRTEEIKTDPTLSPLPDIPIENMLTDSRVDQPTKDILKLLKFGNLVFKTENAMAELLSPKLFDRVFTIPLDVDGFNIDYAKTTASQSGREFLQKDAIQARLDKTAPEGVYRFKPRTLHDTVFEDFFVTIELVE